MLPLAPRHPARRPPTIPQEMANLHRSIKLEMSSTPSPPPQPDGQPRKCYTGRSPSLGCAFPGCHRVLTPNCKLMHGSYIISQAMAGTATDVLPECGAEGYGGGVPPLRWPPATGSPFNFFPKPNLRDCIQISRNVNPGPMMRNAPARQAMDGPSLLLPKGRSGRRSLRQPRLGRGRGCC